LLEPHFKLQLVHSQLNPSGLVKGLLDTFEFIIALLTWMVRRGEIPSIKIGRLWRSVRADLHDCL